MFVKPNLELVSQELALLGDLQTTAIACHVKSMTPLPDHGHEAPVAT
jgi:hypothetical protein